MPIGITWSNLRYGSGLITLLIEIYVHRNLHRGWLGLLLENLYGSLWLELSLFKIED
jgi:hypothetical protein